MNPTRDLIPPGLPWRRRVLLRLRLRWHRIGLVFSDWRYPAALAAACITACALVLAIGYRIGLNDVLDRLDHRGTYSECVDEREAAFETAIGDILDLSLSTEPPSPQRVVDLRRAMSEATADLRAIDNPVNAVDVRSGCPGQVEDLP